MQRMPKWASHASLCRHSYFQQKRFTFNQKWLADLQAVFHELDFFHQNPECDWYDLLRFHDTALQKCSHPDFVSEGRQVHACGIKYGITGDRFLGNKLVNFYSKCYRVQDARQAFEEMPHKDAASWASMISAYAKIGATNEALNAFKLMQYSDMVTNKIVLSSMLTACRAAYQDRLDLVMCFHGHILQLGFASHSVVGTGLVEVYGRCGCLAHAHGIFDELHIKDVVSWTTIIQIYVQGSENFQALEIFAAMLRKGEVEPNEPTLISAIRACAGLFDMNYGEQIHGYAVARGLDSSIVVANALVDMYAKCGRVMNACRVFDSCPETDVILWTTMIALYAESGLGERGLDLFKRMLQQNGLSPNMVTMVSVVRTACSFSCLKCAEMIHAFGIKFGALDELTVGNLLVDMYAKCESMENARLVFDEILHKDVVSWSSLLSGYVRHDQHQEALLVFYEMGSCGVNPNMVTLVSVITSLANLGVLQQGKQIHGHMIRKEYELGLVVHNALLDMYAKCGDWQNMDNLFRYMHERDVVTFTILVLGSCQSGQGDKAMEFFGTLHKLGSKPDNYIMAAVLSVSSGLGLLQTSKQLHSYVIKLGLDLAISVANALIDAYAKSGSIEEARKIFNIMPDRTVVSWNAMIANVARYGFVHEAFDLFKKMGEARIKPDQITFLVILYGCSHGGLVDEGYEIFRSMQHEFGLTPSLDHYICLVDLLGRVGRLQEALHLIRSMPFKPNFLIYKSLLSSSRIHNDFQIGSLAADTIMELKPDDSASYVLCSNLYAEAGRWDLVTSIRKIMKKRGVKKQPGQSWIEIGNRVHAFVSGDRSHPQLQEIYQSLGSLIMKIKEAGYVANYSSVSHDLDKYEAEDILYHHSEKLAIAFGLQNTPSGTPLRIFKNLRVCIDCHTAIKFISKVVNRQIVVRDANRFHVFESGHCTCGDYW